MAMRQAAIHQMCELFSLHSKDPSSLDPACGCLLAEMVACDMVYELLINKPLILQNEEIMSS